MQLQDYFKRFTFDEVFAELQLMLEDADSNKATFSHAYEMMQTLETIPSKKVIHYQIIDDPESEEYFSGAPDSCFNTTWEVILAKEVIVDEECELSDLDSSLMPSSALSLWADVHALSSLKSASCLVRRKTKILLVNPIQLPPLCGVI